MNPIVKICGLTSLAALDAALAAGADMVGLVRFEKSPRHLGLEQGRALSLRARGKAERVALVVDADDAALDAVVAAFDPDLLQLHGAETPERVAAIRARLKRPVMKAIGIASAADLAAVAAYEGVADRLLLDAKPPADAEALPGGNGVPFDWRLIAGLDAAKPVMLSGGLDGDNVAAAIALTGVKAVDVSSGVERRPGDKDPMRIEAFIKAARAAFAALRSEDKVA
jgi:phosphoribosylanthranilate isomerase